ncbi:MAG: hypothetical protein FWJ74_04850 [Gemmatimonadota bacterium]
MIEVLRAWLRRLSGGAPDRASGPAREPGWEVIAAVREEAAVLHARLGDAWARLHALEELERDLARLTARIDYLSARVAHLDEEVMQVDGQVERIRIVESQLDRIESEVARQLEYVHELQGWERRLAELREVVAEFVAHRDAIQDLVEELRSGRSREANRGEVEGGEGAADVGAGTGATELDALPERLKRLAAELARKEAALERAAERLGRVDVLATRAALTVRELEDQNARLMATLQRAEAQTAKVDALVRELEMRMGEVRTIALRVERFEERLMRLIGRQRPEGSDEAAVVRLAQGADGSTRSLGAERPRPSSMLRPAADAPIHVLRR